MGVGVSAATALAVMELRRARSHPPVQAPQGHPPDGPEQETPAAHKLGLRAGEGVPAGLARMRIAQLELAIASLEQVPSNDLERTVHEARKAIKRARSLDRLLHELTDPSAQEHRKDVLKAAALALSGTRDAQVALATLEGVMRRDARKLAGSPGVARLHDALSAEHRTAEVAFAGPAAQQRALRLLSSTAAQLRVERPRGAGKKGAVPTGFERIYSRGQRALRTSSRRGGILEMHEWRKRVKDLRYAAEALTEPSGSTADSGRRRTRLRRIAREADRLGEALGEEHDLALLAARVSVEDQLFRKDAASRKALLKAIARRRRKLRKRAFKAGSSLYAVKPKRFRKRILKVR